MDANDPSKEAESREEDKPGYRYEPSQLTPIHYPLCGPGSYRPSSAMLHTPNEHSQSLQVYGVTQQPHLPDYGKHFSYDQFTTKKAEAIAQFQYFNDPNLAVKPPFSHRPTLAPGPVTPVYQQNEADTSTQAPVRMVAGNDVTMPLSHAGNMTSSNSTPLTATQSSISSNSISSLHPNLHLPVETQANTVTFHSNLPAATQGISASNSTASLHPYLPPPVATQASTTASLSPNLHLPAATQGSNASNSIASLHSSLHLSPPVATQDSITSAAIINTGTTSDQVCSELGTGQLGHSLHNPTGVDTEHVNQTKVIQPEIPEVQLEISDVHSGISDVQPKIVDVHTVKVDNTGEEAKLICDEREVENEWYKCGSCEESFAVLCKLHKHLKSHGSVGSYYFNYFTKTAYPQFRMMCEYTQTDTDFMTTDDMLCSLDTVADKKRQFPGINSRKNNKILKRAEKMKDKTIVKKIKTEACKVRKRKGIARGTPRKYILESEVSDEDLSISSGKRQKKRKKKRYTIKRKTSGSRSEIDSEGGEVKADVDDVMVKKEPVALEEVNPDIPIDEEMYDYDTDCADYEAEYLTKLSKQDTDDGKSRRAAPRKKHKTAKSKHDSRISLTEDGQYLCNVCSVTFVIKKNCQKHYRDCHGENQGGKLAWSRSKICKFCGENFRSFKLATEHRFICDANPQKGEQKPRGSQCKPTECRWCGEIYPSLRVSLEHEAVCDANMKLKCQICMVRFPSVADVTAHLSTHSNPEELSCKMCTKAFNNVVYFQNHLLKHMEVKNSQCELCGKYVTGKALACHLRNCKEERNEPCQECGQMFKTKQALKFHMSVHSEERPYVCHYCGYAVKKASYLKRHIRSHTGEKPYACRVCGLNFSALNGLNRHSRIHTNDKPYVCQYCGKSFTNNWNLKTHLRQHTGDTPYQCHLCGKAFKQNVLLKLHHKSHHPGGVL